MSNRIDIVEELRRRVPEFAPEFAPDILFSDLPYVICGEFAQFLRARLEKAGSSDDVIRRSAELLNELFRLGDPEVMNIVETSIFEFMADDRLAARAMTELLEDGARESFERIRTWVGGST